MTASSVCCVRMLSNVISVWSLWWHFTNRSITGAPYNIKVTICHSWTQWWRVRWLERWRLQVAAELQQRCRRTNRWRKSIRRSSSSHREGSITQRGVSCGWYKQRLWVIVVWMSVGCGTSSGSAITGNRHWDSWWSVVFAVESLVAQFGWL